MEGLRAEVGRCLTSPVVGKEEIVATFSFPPDFVGFAGHFPDKPVLPGVCVIEAALVILQSHFQKRALLRCVGSAKFLAVVSYGQECTWTCRVIEAEGGGYRLKATVARANDRIAVLDLLVDLIDEAQT